LIIHLPESEIELLTNAEQITGKTLGQLAGRVGVTTPDNQKRAQG